MTLHKDDVSGVLTVSGTLEIDGANLLRETLLNCFLHGPEIKADFSAVNGCDTGALQVLLTSRKDAAAAGKRFCIIAASSAVTETASALGFLMNDSESEWEKDNRSAN